jgi:hypothetical protein
LEVLGVDFLVPLDPRELLVEFFCVVLFDV